MRICHVITRLIVGGAQENTILTCEGLSAAGHEVLLLAGPETGPEGSLWPRVEGGTYLWRRIPSLRREVGLLQEIRAYRELRAAYAEFQPAIIHTHSSKAGILGRSAARHFPQAKVVHTIHGMSFNRTQPAAVRGFYRALERHAARHTDVLVTVADAVGVQARDAGLGPPEKFRTIYSGIELDLFTPSAEKRHTARRRWGVAQDDIVVGTVARLFRHKGYEQLIPAIAQAAAANSKLRFVWIGDGADRDDYLRMVQRLGLHERVTLTGLLAPAEVADLVQGFDLLVHCSQWEGLPRAVVQAQLLEIPAISFDIDGAGEAIRHNHSGILIPLNDDAALTQSILRLAGDAALRARMGRNGRQHCAALFDHRRMVSQLLELYARL